MCCRRRIEPGRDPVKQRNLLERRHVRRDDSKPTSEDVVQGGVAHTASVDRQGDRKAEIDEAWATGEEGREGEVIDLAGGEVGQGRGQEGGKTVEVVRVGLQPGEEGVDAKVGQDGAAKREINGGRSECVEVEVGEGGEGWRVADVEVVE